MKSVFCACAITFQMQSTSSLQIPNISQRYFITDLANHASRGNPDTGSFWLWCNTSHPDGGLKPVVFLRYVRLNNLYTFQKLRKSISFVCRRLLAESCMSLCLSVRMEQLGRNWKHFHKIWYLSIFRKTCQEISIFIKFRQE
jgi:hypothetical protein